MDTQKRLLFASIAGIVVVVGVMIVVGRYLYVEKVRPAVEAAVNKVTETADGIGSSPRLSQDFPVSSLKTLVVEGGWEVSLTRGETATVHVEAPSGVIQDVRVESRDGNVTIGLVHEAKLLQGKLAARITSPALNRIEFRGGVNANIDGFVEPALWISLAGATTVTGTGNRIENFTVNCAGAANVNFRGSKTTNATVTAAGASNIVLTMNGGKLSGRLDGVGKVDYYGPVASESIAVSGLGSVQAKGD
ncbi:MAG TPA: DUF2807 domain-containing protein [Spirochaetia bacterium]|nr:DUF2807 domain-containing protein [Spirochaetia bacterium]